MPRQTKQERLTLRTDIALKIERAREALRQAEAGCELLGLVKVATRLALARNHTFDAASLLSRRK